ncbi:MAG: hypothetical protein U1C49_03295 [Candidatus Andersenbacteria bacterium]|nr:hypothetical protein [bacterium]MDZ4225850.1 hypothetical protein [Candidatus Andersenbacteria bacterium]
MKKIFTSFLGFIQRLAKFATSHYLLLSLLFFVGLELMMSFQQWIMGVAVVLLLLISYGIFLVRWEERGRFNLTQTVLPVLTAMGLAGFSLFIPLTPLIHMYYVLAAVVFFLLLRHGAKQAFPTWNWIITVLVFFLNTAVVLGLRYHLFLPLLLTLVFIFLASFLLLLQALRRVLPGLLKGVLLSLGVAMVLTQLAWVLQFLPIHFLVQAGVIVVFYYVLFHLIRIGYEGKSGRHEITEYVILGTAALLLLLLTARWI